jgi:hypothetical protein
MCSLCATCVTECYCPRCPYRKGKLRGWPPSIQPCTICGLEDDRLCADPVCAITEHFTHGDKLYCQICVETKYETRFLGQQMAMYCKEHEDEHKVRMMPPIHPLLKWISKNL